MTVSIGCVLQVPHSVPCFALPGELVMQLVKESFGAQDVHRFCGMLVRSRTRNKRMPFQATRILDLIRRRGKSEMSKAFSFDKR